MKLSLSEYFEKLSAHDWYFEMSDDHGVYEKGKDDQVWLQGIEHTLGGVYRKMFHDFRGHYFSGEPWGTTQAPRPVLKNYLTEKVEK